MAKSVSQSVTYLLTNDEALVLHVRAAVTLFSPIFRLLGTEKKEMLLETQPATFKT